jgi:hypothetical protein
MEGADFVQSAQTVRVLGKAVPAKIAKAMAGVCCCCCLVVVIIVFVSGGSSGSGDEEGPTDPDPCQAAGAVQCNPNGGTCTATGPTSTECSCNAGYSGDTCGIDPCDNYYCYAGEPRVEGSDCVCADCDPRYGYMGANCAINPCQDVLNPRPPGVPPILHCGDTVHMVTRRYNSHLRAYPDVPVTSVSGNCRACQRDCNIMGECTFHDQRGNGPCTTPMVCECVAGYSGNHCEIDLCDGLTCNGRGVLVRPLPGPRYGSITWEDAWTALERDMPCMCSCESGYGPPYFPEIPGDPTYHANPNGTQPCTQCTDNGQCGDHGSSCWGNSTTPCVCDRGWGGASCDLDQRCDLPEAIDCGSHGSCAAIQSVIVCVCDGSYSGANCSIPPCQRGNECNGHGTCVVSGDDALCTCDGGYTGSNCQFDPCHNEMCSGHGTCVINGSQGICTCDAGYYSLSDPDYQTECGTQSRPGPGTSTYFRLNSGSPFATDWGNDHTGNIMEKIIETGATLCSDDSSWQVTKLEYHPNDNDGSYNQNSRGYIPLRYQCRDFSPAAIAPGSPGGYYDECSNFQSSDPSSSSGESRADPMWHCPISCGKIPELFLKKCCPDRYNAHDLHVSGTYQTCTSPGGCPVGQPPGTAPFDCPLGHCKYQPAKRGQCGYNLCDDEDCSGRGTCSLVQGTDGHTRAVCTCAACPQDESRWTAHYRDGHEMEQYTQNGLTNLRMIAPMRCDHFSVGTGQFGSRAGNCGDMQFTQLAADHCPATCSPFNSNFIQQLCLGWTGAHCESPIPRCFHWDSRTIPTAQNILASNGISFTCVGTSCAVMDPYQLQHGNYFYWYVGGLTVPTAPEGTVVNAHTGTCELPSALCSPNAANPVICGAHGACFVEHGSAQCQCAPGWSGVRCDVSPCAGVTCDCGYCMEDRPTNVNGFSHDTATKAIGTCRCDAVLGNGPHVGCPAAQGGEANCVFRQCPIVDNDSNAMWNVLVAGMCSTARDVEGCVADNLRIQDLSTMSGARCEVPPPYKQPQDGWCQGDGGSSVPYRQLYGLDYDSGTLCRQLCDADPSCVGYAYRGNGYDRGTSAMSVTDVSFLCQTDSAWTEPSPTGLYVDWTNPAHPKCWKSDRSWHGLPVSMRWQDCGCCQSCACCDSWQWGTCRIYGPGANTDRSTPRISLTDLPNQCQPGHINPRISGSDLHNHALAMDSECILDDGRFVRCQQCQNGGSIGYTQAQQTRFNEMPGLPWQVPKDRHNNPLEFTGTSLDNSNYGDGCLLTNPSGATQLDPGCQSPTPTRILGSHGMMGLGHDGGAYCVAKNLPPCGASGSSSICECDNATMLVHETSGWQCLPCDSARSLVHDTSGWRCRPPSPQTKDDILLHAGQCLVSSFLGIFQSIAQIISDIADLANGDASGICRQMVSRIQSKTTSQIAACNPQSLCAELIGAGPEAPIICDLIFFGICILEDGTSVDPCGWLLQQLTGGDQNICDQIESTLDDL